MARASAKPRVTVGQLSLLLKAIENDPSLYNAGKSDMISFLNIQKWMYLTEVLNEVDDAAMLSTQSWKFVLRYWSEKVRKRMKLPKGKQARCKPNPSLTAKERKKLTGLENRLAAFMKKEEAREIVDVTYTANFGAEPKPDNIDVVSNDGGVKVKVQLLNVFPAKSDENTCPNGPRKRTIIMKEDDVPDPASTTKKFKIIYDQNVDGSEPQQQILGNQLECLQVVSQHLETQITSIQDRIHLIKDMWKHRCGDN